MNSLLKVSLSVAAFISLVSVGLFAEAGTNIGGKPGGAVYSNTYRAYSYEPAPQMRTVFVAKAKAELKMGNQVLATIPQGTQLNVVETRGTWVGTTIQQNGRQVTGWVAEADVANNPPAAPAVPAVR